MDLVPQFDLIREAADAYGIPQIEADGYEADDVIATLATLSPLETHILSGDKDLMQLVTEDDDLSDNDNNYVHMIDPMSMSRTDAEAVKEKWGVPPRLVGDILALAGDSSDNSPGVKGIGPKIAAQLLEEYGSLSNLLENTSEITQTKRRDRLEEGKEMALLSRQLVELKRDIPREQWKIEGYSPSIIHGHARRMATTAIAPTEAPNLVFAAEVSSFASDEAGGAGIDDKGGDGGTTGETPEPPQLLIRGALASG